jgi:hypothetical protein
MARIYLFAGRRVLWGSGGRFESLQLPIAASSELL